MREIDLYPMPSQNWKATGLSVAFHGLMISVICFLASHHTKILPFVVPEKIVEVTFVSDHQETKPQQAKGKASSVKQVKKLPVPSKPIVLKQRTIPSRTNQAVPVVKQEVVKQDVVKQKPVIQKIAQPEKFTPVPVPVQKEIIPQKQVKPIQEIIKKEPIVNEVPIKTVEKTIEKAQEKPILQPSSVPIRETATPQSSPQASPQASHEETGSIAPQKKPAAASGDSGNDQVTQPIFHAAYLSNPTPPYPSSAKRRRMQGRTLLKVNVSTAGIAKSVSIMQSSGHSVLDQSALQAVSAWRFVPAKRGTQPVEAHVVVPIDFRLQ